MAPVTADLMAANKQVVARFDALFDSNDLSSLDELCWPDMVNHSLAPNRPAGLDGTRQFLQNARKTFLSDRWDRVNVVAEGDYVVQFGVRAGRWGGGPFLGVDAPAGEYSREVAFVYRLVDGRIAERWAIRDDLTMLRQLGALPPASMKADHGLSS
jgi:predicted ester cyclase